MASEPNQSYLSECDEDNDMGKLEPASRSIFASSWEILTPYCAEFVGTLVITLAFLCNSDEKGNPWFAHVSTGFTVMAMVTATKHISGGNLNPSISVALCLAGRQRPRVACGLVFAQVLGASVAAFLLYKTGKYEHLQIGPQNGHSWVQVGTVEALYATMLCFAYLNCAASKENNPKNDQNGFLGLVCGLCYIASSSGAKSLALSVSNSAIAIGIAISSSSSGGHISTGLGYLMYDLLGAFFAVGAYRVVRVKEYKSAMNIVSTRDVRQDDGTQMVAEFIGTFFIILTQVLARFSANQDVELGGQAWGVAAAQAAMVYSLRNVSGAHFNPAVTLAVRASGRGGLEDFSSKYTNIGDSSSEFRTAIFFVLSQTLAGIVAALVGGIVNAGGVGATVASPLKNATAGQIMLGEGMFTFITCFVVLATSMTMPVDSARSKQNNVSGLAYAACTLAGTFAIGNISGGLLNPASVVTFIFLGILQTNSSLLPYLFYQMFGAVLAASCYLVTHSELYAKELNEADEKTRLKPGLMHEA